MSNYLIDYENVRGDGINGVEKLNRGDSVVIFYSENADTLTFSMHKKINDSPADITLIKVETKTKNALDFQLVTYLGYLIANAKSDKYFIITKDQGFNSVIKFWRAKSIKIEMSGALLTSVPLATPPSTLTTPPKPTAAPLSAEVLALVTNASDANIIIGCMEKFKTKSALHNALVSELKMQNGKELYQIIKPLLKGWK